MTFIPEFRPKLLLSILFALCLLSLPSKSAGNAAMPGYWNTGIGHHFVPMFASDSIYRDLISMEKEDIRIDIFRGYAVVKGTYWMRNYADSTIALTAGYPVNGEVRNERIYAVIFDDLYNLKVHANGVAVEVNKSDDYLQDINPDVLSMMADADNWYLWDMEFAPDTLTKIEVYFIVNTNDAKLRRGYNIESKECAFAYILESGRAWAGAIGEGSIRIRLNDDLTADDVIGILPDSSMSTDGDTRFSMHFTELEPDTRDNIVFRYKGKNDNLNMEAVVKQSGNLYNSLDSWENSWDDSNFTTFTEADFRVEGPLARSNFKLITWIVVGTAALGLIFGFVYLRIQKQKQARQS